MKSHLEYTSDEYLQEPDARGVRPISVVDCQIIAQIITLLSQSNDHKDLSLILDGWKDEADETVLKRVSDYYEGIIDLPDKELADKEGDEISFYNLFIRIKEQVFRAVYLMSIGTQNDYEDGRPIYNIIINRGPLPAKHAWYENRKIQCYSEEEREKEIKALEDKLTKYNICKFL